LQIPWLPGISLKEYAKDRDKATYPIILKCPICGAEIKLYRHGFYSRNVITPKRDYRIDICRYFCRSCRGTISLLPVFLLPYFQHDRHSILKCLRDYFIYGVFWPYRQMAGWYRQRFSRNLAAIIGALRERRLLYQVPDDENEKAIKVIGRLVESPARAMTVKSHYTNRILYNFMAYLL
jgi:transposase-like protein